jgi:alpha-1,6-mannosyltransferase
MLANAPSRLAADLAQPLTVVTAWGPFGARLFALLAGGTLISVAALAALCLRAARGGGDLPAGGGGRAALVLCAALGLGAALSWPCIFSSDVYAYAAYGDQTLHGQNPYRPAPPTSHDAFLDAARRQWTRVSFPPCVYGPAFVAAAAVAVAAAGRSIVPALWLLRLLACAALLGGILLLDVLLEGAPRRRIRVALFALNPVVLWSAAEGHNDTLVVAAVLGGILAARRGRPALAGAVLAATPLLKAIGLLAGPGLWTTLAGRERAVFARTFAALGLAVAAIVVPLQLGALAGLAQHGRYAPQFSLQGLLGPVAALLCALALALSALPGLRARRPAATQRLALALWLAIPNPYPWYALWIAPLVTFGALGWEGAALFAATISVTLRYLPDAFGDVSGAAATSIAAGVVLPAGLAALAVRGIATKEATPSR